MKDKAALLAQLCQFTGTSQYYYHPNFRTLNYTDGVKFVAQEMEAYWFLEHVLIHQTIPEAKGMEFQVWKMVVKDSSAIITIDDGNGNVVKEFKIPFTDFPLDEITFWVEGNVLLLPSEH